MVNCMLPCLEYLDLKTSQLIWMTRKKQHGYKYGTPYTANVVYRTVLEDEIEKYKKSDDYQGPDLFDEGNHLFQKLSKYIYF